MPDVQRRRRQQFLVYISRRKIKVMERIPLMARLNFETSNVTLVISNIFDTNL